MAHAFRNRSGRFAGAIALLTVALASIGSLVPVLAQEGSGTTLKGGVEERYQGSNAPVYPAAQYTYPAPQMVQPKAAPIQRPPQHQQIRGAVEASPPPVQRQPPPPQRPPMQTSLQQTAPPGVLPPQFLGAWQVQGMRQSVEAAPQYQSGIGNIFTMMNQQIWQIVGNPQSGYALQSNTGVQTQIYVDKVQGRTAYLRYQHPIRNTMAQEAIVMELSADGLSFQGLERISIVKQGEGTRAKVQYSLNGRRQN